MDIVGGFFMKWTVHKLQRLKKAVCLHGDIWIPPGAPDPWRVKSTLWARYHPHRKATEFVMHGMNDLLGMILAYEQNPGSLKKRPSVLRQLIERDGVLNGQHPLVDDPLAANIHVPYSHIHATIQVDGFTHEVCRLFHLFRLQGVKQLGYLCPPLEGDDYTKVLSFPFEHNRLQHIYDVYVISLFVGINVGLSEKELNTLLLAALTHDCLTPAGGDTVKAIDPHGFDEDLHYPAFLQSLDLRSFQKKYPFDSDLLLATIRNEGVLGTLLDIADKSYVFRDASVMRRVDPKRMPPHPVDEVLNDHRWIGDIWECVRVQDGQVYFSSSTRLFYFLLLRARLFQYVYRNPESRTQMHVLVMTLLRYLYDGKHITRTELIEMQDGYLEQRISTFLFGEKYVHSFFEYVECVEAHTKEEAVRIRNDRIGKGFLASVEKIPPGKPATHFLVKRKGKLIPFREACPDEAAFIDATMKVQGVWWVFVHPVPLQLVPQHHDAFVRFLQNVPIQE